MLREMYFGKVIPWERRNRKNEEHLEIVRKIEDEERYFVQKMSLDDCERFQKLSNLYSQKKTADIEMQIAQLENRQKKLIQEQKLQERKDRTKRLCKRMGFFHASVHRQMNFPIKDKEGFAFLLIASDHAVNMALCTV